MDCVGTEVEQNGVGSAIVVVEATAIWKRYIGWAGVSPVEEDDSVVLGDGGMHGGNAGIGNQDFPRAVGVGTCSDDREGDAEEL